MILLVAIYCVMEVVGGLWTGSLALLADASHMASDLLSLFVSVGAAWLTLRQPGGHQTFGLHRAEILAALFNGVLLFVVGAGIVREAWERLWFPHPILAEAMLLIATGGLLVNVISLMILHGARNHNLNLRSAWLHVVGDALGSVAVIVAAIFIWLFNWTWADPVASLVACSVILFSATRLIVDAIWILMEHAPREIDMELLQKRMLNTAGVQGIHHLHVWSIASGRNALSAHVIVEEGSSLDSTYRELRNLLRSEFPLEHLTLQMEASDSDGCLDQDHHRE